MPTNFSNHQFHLSTCHNARARHLSCRLLLMGRPATCIAAVPISVLVCVCVNERPVVKVFVKVEKHYRSAVPSL